MSTKSILLVNDDPSLVECLQKTINWTLLSTRDTSRLRQKFRQHVFPFVILETKKDWTRDLKRLLQNGKSVDDCFMIIASANRLKQTAERIKDIIAQIFEKISPVPSSSPAHPKPAPHRMKTDLVLEEFVEHRLKDFVKQMKTSGGRNLYSILLREIECPLIRITLAETNGNQIQAAHLLGMNRNTLRKKIKELKIPMNKNPSKKRQQNSA